MKRKGKIFVAALVLVLVLLAEYFTGGIVINNMDDYMPEEPVYVEFEDFGMYIELFANKNYIVVPFAVSYMRRSDPYRLSISGFSDNRSHERMTVTSAKIIDGSGKEYLLTDDIFPVTENFRRQKTINTNDDEPTYTWYYYFVTKLKIPYDKEDTVKAVVDFEIETKNGTRKHKVEQVFKHDKSFGIMTFRRLIMIF